MIRSSFGTIGRGLTHAQTIGSLIPTSETWHATAYSHLRPAPKVHEVTVEQTFIPNPSPPSQEGCVISQEFTPTVDADGDIVMVDAQNIVPE